MCDDECENGFLAQRAPAGMEVATMPTNLAIDDRLIQEAQRIGEHKTKKAAVTAALQEYVQRRKQSLILDIFGTIEYGDDYDYKTERSRDSE